MPTGSVFRQRARDVAHLARRFFGSLSHAAPLEADESWATSHLIVGEQALWLQMSNPDRRHAIGVARLVADELGADATRPVVAAALLHDVGKVDSGLGTFARVGATLWAGVRGRRAASSGDGRVARYLRHDGIGADLLRGAGSDSLTWRWAGEHHLDPARWQVERRIADVLKACDDD